MTTGAGAHAAYEAHDALQRGVGRERSAGAFMRGAAQAAGLEPQERLAAAAMTRAEHAVLTDAQLDARISRIHVLLAAANDEKQRRIRERGTAHAQARAEFLAEQNRPLDPTDDGWPFP